jgi:hypothetical protein
MASEIVKFWRQCSGPIHPADADVLSSAPGLFNLDFPPPAYVGDIEHAPVVLLNGNGGYKPSVTPLEFPDAASVQRAIARMHNPTPVESSDISKYYTNANYARWLKSGEMAMVNAVAYRAPNITAAVARVAKKLPSTQLHIQWLMDEVMPAVRSGKRFVVAHRNRLWNLSRNNDWPGFYFSSNPRLPHLSQDALSRIDQFLKRQT